MSSQYLWSAWEKMIELSVKPNAQIYTSIISIFIESGNLEMAIQLLFAMKSKNIVPELCAVQDVIIFTAEMGYPRLALDLATYFEDNSHRRVGDDVWVTCLYSAAKALYVSSRITLSHNTYHHVDRGRHHMLETCC
jgi:pentatricopeptide repeat protein